MAEWWIAPMVITIIWGFIGIICPIICAFLPRCPNKGVTQCCLMLTAVTCWLFWLCNYMTQLHPFIGPKLSQNEILIVAREWGDPIIQETN